MARLFLVAALLLLPGCERDRGCSQALATVLASADYCAASHPTGQRECALSIGLSEEERINTFLGGKYLRDVVGCVARRCRSSVIRDAQGTPRGVVYDDCARAALGQVSGVAGPCVAEFQACIADRGAPSPRADLGWSWRPGGGG